MGREAYDNLQSRLRERHDRDIVDLRERFALPWQAGYTAPQPPLSRSLLATIRDEQRWRENGVPGRIDVGGAWAARFDDVHWASLYCCRACRTAQGPCTYPEGLPMKPPMKPS
jgi:hypothetical protein